MEIGFIGLGKMGFPMARRLIEAGHRLTVFDTDRAAVDALAAQGAVAAASPAAVADAVETVLASLPTPSVVQAVATGAQGVIAGKAVRCFVDLSTTGSVMAQRIAAALGGRGIVQIDAPVSGGVAGAEKGTLAVMVSGPRAAVEPLLPVFSVLGKPFVIGERAGAGQVMKLINNLLSATALAATSEAVGMGLKAGLDPAVMIEVINSGTGRNSASLDKFPRNILPGRYDAGFATGLMVKDLRLCFDEAKALSYAFEVGEAVRRLWEESLERSGPEADFTTIMQTVERKTGVTLHGKE